jgi:hypothetical protein
MASVYSASTEGQQPLAAATAERVLWVMGVAGVKARIVEWGIAFTGVSATAEPVDVKLFRTTNAGTTPTAATAKPWDPDNPTANCTAAKAFTTEPTREAQALMETHVHPQTGLIIQYPLGREIVLDNATTSGIAIECTAPAAVDVTAYVVWEE